jgi:hypothetical protein
MAAKAKIDHPDAWAVSVEELARRLDIPRRVIDQAIRNEELEAKVYGYGVKRPRITREAATEWIRDHWESYHGR